MHKDHNIYLIGELICLLFINSFVVEAAIEICFQLGEQIPLLVR
ncbi:hypothetical protein MtrunA17_Chr0c01g0489341 [Medicago truncatula]|uniref:Uncharacterized protein n=1 Tax=Medicago truncatula TaxID=3880 RepID=A0A396GIN0_MEDTR|nr:hypothetical protein MtrunA17_Chr0c01g0489341 [Medicago truncatula]